MSRYFLSRLSPLDSKDGDSSYWRAGNQRSFTGWLDPGDADETIFASGKPTSSGIRFQINLNLLAYARGNTLPVTDRGCTYVDPLPYPIWHTYPEPDGDPPADFSIDLRPFVQASDASGGNAKSFPIGSALRDFLDDPLNVGESLGLALGDFLALAVQDKRMQDAPLELLMVFLDEFSIQGGVMAKPVLLLDVLAYDHPSKTDKLIELSAEKGGLINGLPPISPYFMVRALKNQASMPSSVLLNTRSRARITAASQPLPKGHREDGMRLMEMSTISTRQVALPE